MRPTVSERIEGGIDQQLAIRMLLAMVVALGANLALLFGASDAGIGEGFVAFSATLVFVFTTLGVLAAAGCYAILESWISTPIRAFRRLAFAGFVLSLAPASGLVVMHPRATAPAVGVLVTMHLITAVVCLATIPSIQRSGA